jgi:hypothetical protein
MDIFREIWAWILNALGIRPNKRDWPECVGMSSGQAGAVIHRDWRHAVIICTIYREPKPGFQYFSTRELQIDRVKITLEKDKVKNIPHLEWWA